MKSCQKGLSLIELMIALTLSTFLMLGVTQIYVDNQRSYLFRQSQANNQDGTRYAMIFLQQELAKAGYRRRPDESVESAFPAQNVSGCNFLKGEVVKFVSTNSICIRYQPRDHTERDCMGSIVDSTLTEPYTKTSSLVTQLISLNTENNVINCTSGDTTAAMVMGTVDLRFEYGVGSAASPQNLSSFIKTTASDTQPVIAVRYTTMVRSNGVNMRDSTTVGTALANWKALTGVTDSEITTMQDNDKGHLYQVAQNTVMLRNRMP